MTQELFKYLGDAAETFKERLTHTPIAENGSELDPWKEIIALQERIHICREITQLYYIDGEGWAKFPSYHHYLEAKQELNQSRGEND